MQEEDIYIPPTTYIKTENSPNPIKQETNLQSSTLATDLSASIQLVGSNGADISFKYQLGGSGTNLIAGYVHTYVFLSKDAAINTSDYQIDDIAVARTYFDLPPVWVPRTVTAYGMRGGEYYLGAFSDQVAWIGARDGGIFRTTDGGETWANVSGGNDTLRFLDIEALSENTALITGWSCGPQMTYIHRTTDGGTNWEMITKPAEGGNWFIVYYADRYICDYQKVST